MGVLSPAHGHKYTVCMPTREGDSHGMELSPSVRQHQDVGMGARASLCRKDRGVCQAKEMHQAFSFGRGA